MPELIRQERQAQYRQGYEVHYELGAKTIIARYAFVRRWYPHRSPADVLAEVRELLTPLSKEELDRIGHNLALYQAAQAKPAGPSGAPAARA